MFPARSPRSPGSIPAGVGCWPLSPLKPGVPVPAIKLTMPVVASRRSTAFCSAQKTFPAGSAAARSWTATLRRFPERRSGLYRLQTSISCTSDQTLQVERQTTGRQVERESGSLKGRVNLSTASAALVTIQCASTTGRVAARLIPSPYCAKPGMLIGSLPPIGISPNNAFTAEISDGGTVL